MIPTLLHTTAIAIVLAAGTGLALAQGVPGGQPGGQPGGMAQSPGTAAGTPADGTKAQPPGQAAGSQPATVGGAMSDEQVRTQLSAQGYTDIQSIMRDGNDFRVRAMQSGRPMDLRVDAYTGTVRSSTAGR